MLRLALLSNFQPPTQPTTHQPDRKSKPNPDTVTPQPQPKPQPQSQPQPKPPPNLSLAQLQTQHILIIESFEFQIHLQLRLILCCKLTWGCNKRSELIFQREIINLWRYLVKVNDLLEK